MPWFLYLALKQLFPTGRRFPFFTAISVTGVALGVAVLVIVTSVMGGFGHEIRRMIVQTEGEVQVKANGLIEDPAAVLGMVRASPATAGATPFVEGPVGAVCNGRPAYPEMRGIDVGSVASVANLARFVRAGRLEDLDDDSVILSWELAQRLGAGIGAEIEVYSPLLFERLKADEVVLPRRLRVAGLFEIGHQHLDSSVAYVTLRAAQELYGLGRTLMPWTHKWESFLWVLNLEKTINFFLLLFIVVIAAF
ncbi:MAG: ABC transporter permease, partial [Opitutaceae bacterium]